MCSTLSQRRRRMVGLWGGRYHFTYLARPRAVPGTRRDAFTVRCSGVDALSFEGYLRATARQPSEHSPSLGTVGPPGSQIPMGQNSNPTLTWYSPLVECAEWVNGSFRGGCKRTTTSFRG